MRDDFDYRRDDADGGEEVYSKVVRAGKRTYFFDVKETRGGEYFVTLTESRKKIGRDGTPVFDKTKIHLYKEDFNKFAEGFEDALGYLRRERPEYFEEQQERSSTDDEFDRL